MHRLATIPGGWNPAAEGVIFVEASTDRIYNRRRYRYSDISSRGDKAISGFSPGAGGEFVAVTAAIDDRYLCRGCIDSGEGDYRLYL
jgi:hypothetical protein